MGSRNKRNDDKKGEDELHSLVGNLVTSICTSEDFLTRLTDTIASIIERKFSKQIELLKTENTKLNKKIDSQEKVILSLVNRQEKLEQQDKMKNVLIFGVNENERENCSETVKTIFKSKMKLEMKDCDLGVSYRIGKINKNKSRPIIVKFSNLYSKNMIYGNKKLLKSTGIVIREDLTSSQQTLLKATLKKVGSTGSAWTNHGNIFVKLNDGNETSLIRSFEDLENL
ncbi:unnamed protein product [Phaedon cochleariae]|uniref:Uncharacterized protein n=1 Tax=Phaedon cochleariae TaxID=80249 RepID=A0A9N9X5T0_PHACE|nr:unnamed protein product [Phaedon cochleariae]